MITKISISITTSVGEYDKSQMNMQMVILSESFDSKIYSLEREAEYVKIVIFQKRNVLTFSIELSHRSFPL